MRPAGKKEPTRGGRAKNEEKKRACFPYSFSHSLCSSVSRSRLVSRLVVPSRSVVSFPVCFFFVSALGRLARRLVLSSRYCVSSSCSSSLASVSLLTPFVFASVPVRRHHCHSRRRSCLAPLPLLSFSFLSSVSPRLASHVSSAFPYCRPLDIPYETSDAHDVPLICSPGRLPPMIVMRSRWGN